MTEAATALPFRLGQTLSDARQRARWLAAGAGALRG